MPEYTAVIRVRVDGKDLEEAYNTIKKSFVGGGLPDNQDIWASIQSINENQE